MREFEGTTPAPEGATPGDPDVIHVDRPQGLTDEEWAEKRRVIIEVLDCLVDRAIAGRPRRAVVHKVLTPHPDGSFTAFCEEFVPLTRVVGANPPQAVEYVDCAECWAAYGDAWLELE